MKVNVYGVDRHQRKAGLLAVAMILVCGIFQQASAQTIDIGPNQYAFRYTGNNNYGLYFNLTNSQYEFRNGTASPIFGFDANSGAMATDLSFDAGSDMLIGANRYAFRYSGDPDFGLYFNDDDSRYEFLNGGANPVFGFSALNGNMTTDLEFAPSASYVVPPNRYALRSAANANIGLYFGASDYEFRNNAGTSVLNINANTGEINSTAGITAAGASVFNNGLRVGGGFNSGTSSSSFRVGTTTLFTAMDNNELQAYSSGDPSLLYLNFWGGNINIAGNTMYVDRDDERVGINTSVPGAKLDVQGETGSTEAVIDAQGNYTGGNVDVRAVNADAVIAPGYGYGVDASGGYRGVYGFGNGTSYTGTTTGVYGTASGTAGTRIGVYGFASGGNTNWAMYAAGDSYVSGDLRVGNQSDVPGYRLSVDGNVICEELKVQLSGDWPDYVFADDYSMMNLNELEEYIEVENHLPGIPSAAEVEEENGIMMGEMQRLTVEKLEELTLYILELKKENDSLKERIEALEN